MWLLDQQNEKVEELERADTFIKYLAGDWMNHLSIRDQLQPVRSTVGALLPAEPDGESNTVSVSVTLFSNVMT